MFKQLAKIIMGLWISIWPGYSLAAELASRYISKNASADAVVVFVHGILGNSTTTWTNGNLYWPSMMKEDNAFKEVDIYVYEYPTSIQSTYSIDELSDNMRLVLDSDSVTSHRQIIFLAHSMGGLVTRAFLLKYREIAEKTRFIYFFSTPTTGSELANYASLISLAPQLSGMRVMVSDSYLADLQRQWLAAQFSIASYCAYEKLETFELKVVTQASAASLCTKPLDPIDADHLNIVKPDSPRDLPFLAFKSAFEKESSLSTSRPVDPAVIAEFERVMEALNRTLMHTDEDLFPIIDQYLANPEESTWRNVKATSQSLLDEIEEAVKISMDYDAKFYELGAKIVRISEDASLTVVNQNFRRTFRDTRKEWNGRRFILKEITRTENRPTLEETKLWATKLKTYYRNLADQMNVLLNSLRQPT